MEYEKLWYGICPQCNINITQCRRIYKTRLFRKDKQVWFIWICKTCKESLIREVQERLLEYFNKK